MSDVVEKMQRIIASDHCTADQMCGDCPCKETASRIFSEIMSPAIESLRAENEKLRAALKTVCLGVVSERESLDWFIMDGAALRVARDAIRESGE